MEVSSEVGRRPRRRAAERRAQRARAMGRAVSHLASAMLAIETHRGGQLSPLAAALASALSHGRATVDQGVQVGAPAEVDGTEYFGMSEDDSDVQDQVTEQETPDVWLFPHERAQQCADEVRAHVSLALAERVSVRTVYENGGVCVETLVPQAGQGYDAAGAGFDQAGQGHDAVGAGFDRAGQGHDATGARFDRAGQGLNGDGAGFDRADQGHDGAGARFDRAGQGYDGDGARFDRAGQGYDGAVARFDRAGQGHDGDGAGFDRAGQGYDTRCVGAELIPQERVQLRTGARVGQLVLNAPVLQMSEEDSLLIARIKELQRTADEGVRDDAWVMVTTPGKRPYYWHQRDGTTRWSLPAGLRPGWVRVLKGCYVHIESQAETWTLPDVAELRR